MKRLLIGLALAGALAAQTKFTNAIIPSKVTVAQLPAASSSNNGQVFTVTNGSTVVDCTVGGGTNPVGTTIQGLPASPGITLTSGVSVQ